MNQPASHRSDWTSPVPCTVPLFPFPGAMPEALLKSVLILNDGDVVRVARSGYSDFFQLGTVVGYAIKSNRCPLEEINRCIQQGHDLSPWLNAIPSVLDCSGLSPEEKAMSLSPLGAKLVDATAGKTLVWVHGRLYRIDPAPNHNLKLVELSEAPQVPVPTPQ